MRRSRGKKLGYIIVPLVIPSGQNAEHWLESCDGMEGWQELGQILNALRAHDGRIEHRLAELMHCYLPAMPEAPTEHLVTIQSKDGANSYIYTGCASDIEPALAPPKGRRVRDAVESLEEAGGVRPVAPDERLSELPRTACAVDDRKPSSRRILPLPLPDKKDWEHDMRGWNPQPVIDDHKRRLQDALARPERSSSPPMRKPQARKAAPGHGIAVKPKTVSSDMQNLLTKLNANTESGKGVILNVLKNSGLSTGPKRDMNILQNTVEAAAELLRSDGFEEALKRQLGMKEQGDPGKGRTSADACTVTSLLVTNATMMHVRIARESAITGLKKDDVAHIAASEAPAERMIESWNRILDLDYRPVFSLARDILQFVTREERKTAALDAALRRIAKDAEAIADTYAEMGMDHAGELFNKVMGDQSSDGAYFTRPLAATMLAELALHATEETRWNDSAALEKITMFDPTCGSGTLLVAWLSALKRRARQGGLDERSLSKLYRQGVEETVAGLDINPISLQLAGAQLSLGDPKVRYRRMNLFRMPYGDQHAGMGATSTMAGSLELLTDSRVLDAQGKLFDTRSESRGHRVSLKLEERDDMEDQVEIVRGRRVVLMNPPFVARTKLGKRFGEEEQARIRRRIDGIQGLVDNEVPSMKGMSDKNSTQPLYVVLGLKAVDRKRGVLGMVVPTVALLAPSGLVQRRILARELHVRYVLACHAPGNVNMSQSEGGGMNESLVIGTRCRSRIDEGTKFVSTDSWPKDEEQAIELCRAIVSGGDIPNGRFTLVPQSRMEEGDWSACAWRSLELSNVKIDLMKCPNLAELGKIQGVLVSGDDFTGMKFVNRGTGDAGILTSRGMGGQQTIEGKPDMDIQFAAVPDESGMEKSGRVRELVCRKGANLFLSAGHDTRSARLSAVAATHPQLGRRTGWLPVRGIGLQVAKAWAVWFNSTPGRILVFENRGKTLGYPVYRPAGLKKCLVPDPAHERGIQILAAAWESTRNMVVPSFREGRANVRDIWDDAVARAFGLDRSEIFRWADLLNAEPYVSPNGFIKSLLEG